MARDKLWLGVTPAEEDCIQMGAKDYDDVAARKEARRHVELLEAVFPERPDGVSFRISREQHDLGSYLDVVIAFDNEVEVQQDFAFFVEAHAPTTWGGRAGAKWRNPPEDGACERCHEKPGELTRVLARESAAQSVEWVCFGCEEQTNDPEEDEEASLDHAAAAQADMLDASVHEDWLGEM